MVYRLLCDENVEHEIGFRLENYGHDIEHVDFVQSLGKGISDERIAEYSISEDRLIVTYDDDFVIDFDRDSYQAVLYIPDLSLSPATVADVIHEMSVYYEQSEISGVEPVTTEWL
jgi:predicted nuclease of predicted toxin-antitoxin system